MSKSIFWTIKLSLGFSRRNYRGSHRIMVTWLFLLCCTLICCIPPVNADTTSGDLSYPEMTFNFLPESLEERLDGTFTFAGFEGENREDQEIMDTVLKSLQEDSKDDTEGEKTKQRWSSFLPIWGEEARAMGHELPRPFGASAGFFYGNRDIDVDSVDIDIRNISLNLDGLADVKVKSTEENWSMRLDAWVVPFFNLYLLGGYTRQHSDVGLDLNLRKVSPLPPLIPRHFTIRLDLDGTTFGGGGTLVGGYKDYYCALDLNYTISDLKGDLTEQSSFDQTVDALLFSARLGWRTHVGSTKVNLWLGGTYWGISQTIDGDVEIPLLGKVDFRVEESPKSSVSMHFGAHVEFTESLQFICDVGSNFADIFTVTPSFMFRF